MPFSELHHQLSSKGKFESAQHQHQHQHQHQPRQANCSSDLAAFVPENEFVELVWENGQIMMQGQSSKSRKNPPSSMMSHISKDQGDAVTPKFDKFGADPLLNDFSSSGNMGLAAPQEDDLVRWLNYPLDDNDDCSDFFSELSGENLNALPPPPPPQAVANAVPTKPTIHSLRDSHALSSSHPDHRTKFSVGEAPPRTTSAATQLRSSAAAAAAAASPPLHQFHTSLQSPTFNPPHNLSFTNGHHHHHHHHHHQSNTTMDEKQDTTGPTRPPPPPPTNSNSGFLNFSHFLRPAIKTNNLQSSSASASAGRAPPAPPSSSGPDRFRTNDKVSAMGSTNAMESTVIESTSGSRSTAAYQSHPLHMPPKVDAMPPTDKSSKEALCQEDVYVKKKKKKNNNTSSDQASFCASTAMGKPESEKVAAETTVVASSSVCSGASNDPKHLSKRKSRDTEDSEYPSEDVEEESVAAKKPATGRGSTSTKRSRAAEVHNLSERRRRDRINEKMRALQELIPNCNKVDKASMLDEAIEYLKTLQLQVQIMSMGTGLCMPPMMLPPGMQRMHAPHMSPFSPMGGASSACPLIQVPPMHGPQFPCGTVPGPSSLPMMTGSSAQMFGLPGQGLSMPRPPFVHMPGAPSTRPASSPIVPGPADVEEIQDPALHSSSKDQNENLDLQMPKTNSHSLEHQVIKEGFEQSAMAQKIDQNKHDGNN
ncbi:hypothetical protein Syun_008228 [Stephania yunnanensis]|uniref:BHLH domain-containing protein n=1 Tax=Stephania yunnanensis TaxID=152371 RepID=A0AAP0PZ85_9MAGN